MVAVDDSSSPHDVGGTQGGPDKIIPYLAEFARKYDLFYNGDQLPYDTKLTMYARELRKPATKEERRLWKFLRELPVKVLRQRPIAHYIVDFYIPKNKVVIELDGGQHYTDVGKLNDSTRTNILAELELTVLRYSNKDIWDNFDGVCMDIWNHLDLGAFPAPL